MVVVEALLGGLRRVLVQVLAQRLLQAGQLVLIEERGRTQAARRRLVVLRGVHTRHEWLGGYIDVAVVVVFDAGDNGVGRGDMIFPAQVGHAEALGLAAAHAVLDFTALAAAVGPAEITAALGALGAARVLAAATAAVTTAQAATDRDLLAAFNLALLARGRGVACGAATTTVSSVATAGGLVLGSRHPVRGARDRAVRMVGRVRAVHGQLVHGREAEARGRVVRDRGRRLVVRGRRQVGHQTLEVLHEVVATR